MKKYDVFISHKSQDKNALTKIERFLTQNNITWWSDSKLQPGLDWTKQIDQAISESKIMLVLLSQHVIDDPDNMEAEIVSATRNRLKYVVVKLDDSLMEDYTGVFSLYLMKVQWLNASTSLESIFNSILISIKMNLSQTKDQKSELNEQLEVELKRLAKKQKEEYDRNFQNQVMEGIMDYNIARIRSMLNDGKFIQASNEVNSLLMMKRSWKYLELKLLCVTKNFTTNTPEAARLLNEIKNSDIPEVEYKRILSTIQSSEKDKKIALEKERERQIALAKEAKAKEALKKQEDIQNVYKKIAKIKNIKRSYFSKSLFRFIIALILSAAFCFTLFSEENILIMVGIMILPFTLIFKNGFLRFIIFIASIVTISMGFTNHLDDTSSIMYNFITENIYENHLKDIILDIDKGSSLYSLKRYLTAENVYQICFFSFTFFFILVSGFLTKQNDAKKPLAGRIFKGIIALIIFFFYSVFISFLMIVVNNNLGFVTEVWSFSIAIFVLLVLILYLNFYVSSYYKAYMRSLNLTLENCYRELDNAKHMR